MGCILHIFQYFLIHSQFLSGSQQFSSLHHWLQYYYFELNLENFGVISSMTPVRSSSIGKSQYNNGNGAFFIHRAR